MTFHTVTASACLLWGFSNIGCRWHNFTQSGCITVLSSFRFGRVGQTRTLGDKWTRILQAEPTVWKNWKELKTAASPTGIILSWFSSPVRAPGCTAPFIHLLISALCIYVLFAGLHHILPHLSFPLRIDPLCFQAGGRKRLPDLGSFSCYRRRME